MSCHTSCLAGELKGSGVSGLGVHQLLGGEGQVCDLPVAQVQDLLQCVIVPILALISRYVSVTPYSLFCSDVTYPWLKAQAWESGCLGLNSIPRLCGLGHVTEPPCASVFKPLKWGACMLNRLLVGLYKFSFIHRDRGELGGAPPWLSLPVFMHLFNCMCAESLWVLCSALGARKGPAPGGCDLLIL